MIEVSKKEKKLKNDPNPRTIKYVKVSSDPLRKTTRLLTIERIYNYHIEQIDCGMGGPSSGSGPGIGPLGPASPSLLHDHYQGEVIQD